MKVLNSFYNVLTIKVEDAMTSGTPAIIGTNEEYNLIKNISSKSGILRGKVTLDGAALCGTLAVNPWAGQDKLELTCLTAAGGGMTAVVGTLEPSDDGAKLTLTATPLS